MHLSLPWETRTLKLQAKVAAPDQWNAEKPKLYTLVAELAGRGAAPATIQERFGFRQVEVKGRLFEINGKPIKFRGVSRLDAHPLTGRYLSDATNKKDIELMKLANFNALRVCVFPSHPYTMELTDELGLYVENDGPFCFVWDAARSQDLRNAPFMLERDVRVRRARPQPAFGCDLVHLQRERLRPRLRDGAPVSPQVGPDAAMRDRPVGQP